MKVAIQGFEGSFHHIAAENYFGSQIEILSCTTFRTSVDALIDGHADAAVMAIENSIAGSILPNYNILQNSAIRVIGEEYLAIQQNLLVLPGTRLEDITEVQSHPMAFLQCTDYLDNHPEWRLVETNDTARSALTVAQCGQKHIAAIAGELPARLYGLEVLTPSINTIRNNYTRFMILVRTEDAELSPENINKASLFFEVDHTQGSLGKVLKAMELYDMNMTKLQSYPIPSDPWKYLFHLDMEFEDIDQYRAALALMSHHSQKLRVYGEYQKGKQ